MNLHDDNRESVASLIKTAKPSLVTPLGFLEKSEDQPRDENGRFASGGGGGGGSSGPTPKGKWDGSSKLQAGHTVRLTGENEPHLVLESEDERGEMPRILVQAHTSKMTIKPTERVARHFVLPDN